jgi:hypothetical protein
MEWQCEFRRTEKEEALVCSTALYKHLLGRDEDFPVKILRPSGTGIEVLNPAYPAFTSDVR